VGLPAPLHVISLEAAYFVDLIDKGNLYTNTGAKFYVRQRALNFQSPKVLT